MTAPGGNPRVDGACPREGVLEMAGAGRTGNAW